MYATTVLSATLALFAATAAASPTDLAVFKRQGMQWNKDGNECRLTGARACITRGGDPTVPEKQGGLWSDGQACADMTTTYTAKTAKGINDKGETGFCTITMKPASNCCINGKCSAVEIGRDRKVEKTTDAYTEETIGDVKFSVACPKGAYVQSELRLT